MTDWRWILIEGVPRVKKARIRDCIDQIPCLSPTHLDYLPIYILLFFFNIIRGFAIYSILLYPTRYPHHHAPPSYCQSPYHPKQVLPLSHIILIGIPTSLIDPLHSLPSRRTPPRPIPAPVPVPDLSCPVRLSIHRAREQTDKQEGGNEFM